jgi:lipopolysaccharide transport system ATP-binding protein
MSDTVIKIENIWKEYRLGVVSHHSMAKDLQRWWAHLRGKEDPNARIGTGIAKAKGVSGKGMEVSDKSSLSSPIRRFTDSPIQSSQEAPPPEDRFWALRDVSFEVNRGDIVGIIGRNGAGKSTLLKILSNVTTPTRGQVSYKGRIASLLEVGTGFHPELTGRENIFLNGAILGMTKVEIKRKFDEIVAFAEVEKFIDTPVKRYSSGMYVRLAFAVAAHLEPEILIVDEVLAVGDAEFQKKCLGKMNDVSKEGRTVIFVSHNMAAIINLCKRAILMESGSVKYSGNTSDAINMYSDEIKRVACIDLTNYNLSRRGNQEFAKIISISVYDVNGIQTITFAMGETIIIKLLIDFYRDVSELNTGIMLRGANGVLIHDFRSLFDGFNKHIKAGRHVFHITVPEIKVYPGTYTLGPWIQRQVGIPSDDYIAAALKITITDKSLIGHPNSQFERVNKEGSEVYHKCLWKELL